MADVLAIVLSILGFLVVVPSLWLLTAAVFPAAAERSRVRVTRNPVLSLLLGLAAGTVLVVAVTTLAQGTGPVKLLALLVLVATVIAASVGLAGLSRVVGDRLPSPVDRDRPWRSLVRGAVCLELAFLVPVVGWLGVLPLAAAEGLGAGLLALGSRESATAAAPAVPAPATA